MEDGASGGGSYSYRHMYVDQARAVAAWRSATDWDAAKWIREEQGDWLRRQVDFQIWTVYGDLRPAHVLTYDGVPIITVYRNPYR